MEKYNHFLQTIKGKTIDIIGIGVSNRPLIKLLAQNGAKVTAFDKNLSVNIDEFKDLDIKFCLGDDYLEHLGSQIIFKTPGLHPNNEYLVKAEKNGSKVTSEMEIFFEICPCKIIGITGSDGKTTTTTLIYEILKKGGYNCHLGGNIGKPLLCDVKNMKENDICIVELSSFQLQTMKNSPQIAVITNLTPNHLDMHTNMQEYIDAKKNIFKYQTENDIFVTNLDDNITKDFESKGNTTFFSMDTMNNVGVFLQDDNIILNNGKEQKTIMKTTDILLRGKHNVNNYLTAICATYTLVDTDIIKEIAQTFSGVPHRIEFVRNFDGVKYYNDSIATSPTRAIAGLNSFDEKVILIAGGYDKKIPFEPLVPHILKNVKYLILVGNTSEKIKNAVLKADNNFNISVFNEFEKAIEYSKEIAQKNDTVILSPACAAFDLFKNFEKRGEKFKEIVNRW